MASRRCPPAPAASLCPPKALALSDFSPSKLIHTTSQACTLRMAKNFLPYSLDQQLLPIELRLVVKPAQQCIERDLTQYKSIVVPIFSDRPLVPAAKVIIGPPIDGMRMISAFPG